MRPPEPADDSFLSPPVVGQEGSIPSLGKSRGLGTAGAWESLTACLPHPQMPQDPAGPARGSGRGSGVGTMCDLARGAGGAPASLCFPHPKLTSIPTPRSWTTLGCSAPHWDPSETGWQPTRALLKGWGGSRVVFPHLTPPKTWEWLLSHPEERPEDEVVPKNITVNTTLSKKHPWLLLRPGGPPRDPPALGSAKCPRRKIFLPPGRQKYSSLPRVLAQGVRGNGPLVTAGPLHVPSVSPPRPRPALLPHGRGDAPGSRCGSTEEIPADSGCARKAGLVLHSLLLPPPVTIVPPGRG